MSFATLWDSLLPIGRDGSAGGYRRYAWTAEDERCRAWFTHSAAERNLRTHCDGNSNLWAWWDSPDAPDDAAAVVTGSHLDSVPDGGA
jgi:beta-ureidopropionase / N-carbamoyl-L-amino-acid hydrolase